MSVETKIEWTDATYNPWHGCKKVSAGCKYCYMFRDKHRYGQDPTKIVRAKPATFNKPNTWKEPRKIFTCSWSDFFIEESDAWRADAWQVIRDGKHHQWQILTKRPRNIKNCLPSDWGYGWPNVWLGVSVENEKTKHRIEILKEVPAAVRFISIEPILEGIRLSPSELEGIDWIILGGESGNDTGDYLYRPAKEMWFVDLIEDAIIAGVPVFVKQLGTYLAKAIGLHDRHGGDANEWPLAIIRSRQFPVKDEVKV